MDTVLLRPQNAAMRTVFAFGLLLCLAACSGDPRSYGITGPGTNTHTDAPSMPGTDPVAGDNDTAPGVSTSGSSYGPTNGPIRGRTGYYGYN